MPSRGGSRRGAAGPDSTGEVPSRSRFYPRFPLSRNRAGTAEIQRGYRTCCNYATPSRTGCAVNGSTTITHGFTSWSPAPPLPIVRATADDAPIIIANATKAALLISRLTPHRRDPSAGARRLDRGVQHSDLNRTIVASLDCTRRPCLFGRSSYLWKCPAPGRPFVAEENPAPPIENRCEPDDDTE